MLCVTPPGRMKKEVDVLYSVPFAHGGTECPAQDQSQMEGLGQLLSADNLRQRGIRLVEGYVDRL